MNLPNERTVEQFPFCVRLNFYYYIYNYIYIIINLLCTFSHTKLFNCSFVRLETTSSLFHTKKVDSHYWEQLTSLLKRLTLFLRKLTAKQTALFHSANNMYMKRINILWRAQTYRLGFLRRKGRFVNRFLHLTKAQFLDFGDLCCNFVGAFEMHLSIAKDTRVNQQKYEPTQKLRL